MPYISSKLEIVGSVGFPYTISVKTLTVDFIVCIIETGNRKLDKILRECFVRISRKLCHVRKGRIHAEL